jgi:hypothetical protein
MFSRLCMVIVFVLAHSFEGEGSNLVERRAGSSLLLTMSPVLRCFHQAV